MHFFHSFVEVLLSQAPAGGPADSMVGTLVPFAFMALVIYFLLIRPANKQRREHAQLLSNLKKDDEVMTTGGIFGRIINIEEKVVTLEVADKVKIRIIRDRIAGMWDPSKPQAQR